MKTIGDQQLVKRINRSVLLRLLRRQSGLSRAQLAYESGLTKSTVSMLVRELIEEGWITEGDVPPAQGLGRPSTPLRLDGSRRGMIGVEVAVEALRVVGVSITGEVLNSQEVSMAHNEPEAVCHQAAGLVAQTWGQLTQGGVRLLGVGVGVPGAFDEVSGVLRFAPNLGWRNVDFLPLITQALAQAGVPPVAVHVQNEADTAALSEYEFFHGDTLDSLIFVTCGAGVGAGIVLNDRLFTGVQGMAGEIGHSILQMDGLLCSCGRRGCAETFFGARALSKLAEPADGGLALGVVLQNLWTTFNPSALVVGGPSCERHPGIVDVAQATLLEYAASAGVPSPPVRAARYGLLASAVGAAAMVLYHELRPMHAQAHHGTTRAADARDPSETSDAPSTVMV